MALWGRGGGALVRGAVRGLCRRGVSTAGGEEERPGSDSRLRVALALGATATALYLLKDRLRVARALRHTDMVVLGGEEAGRKRGGLEDLHDLEELAEVPAEKKRRPLTAREKRFLRFASLESTGTIYMTPRDFLDSVTQEHPRQRIRRAEVSEDEIQKWLRRTPGKHGASRDLFRRIDAKGVISFTEYLFLLSVLTKPRSGFDIAFNMFDMDGNSRVDKKEFLVIKALTTHLRDHGRVFKFGDYLENEEMMNPKFLATSTSLETLQKGENGPTEPVSTPDTTLLVHFFGTRGNKTMGADDFARFYENLQTEVLEMEFSEFSRGKATITESDFARILLRYTLVHTDDYNEYLQRLAERIPEEKGITFDQFQHFCKFLNNIEDFETAIKLFSFADMAIAKDEFARAVKVSTGFALEDHVIETVFTIFDVNGDGELSHSEFIAVMKDRIHRGFRSHLVKQHYGWDSFKSCIREEMKLF